MRNLLVLSLCAYGCGGAPPGEPSLGGSAKFASAIPTKNQALTGTPFFVPLQIQPDPTLRLSGDASEAYAIMDGVRTQRTGQTLRVALQRLPTGMVSVQHAPKHLGGGYFFRTQNILFRSDTWLGDLKIFATLPSGVRAVWFGFDAVMVQGESLTSYDPQTGAANPPRGLPRSPLTQGMVAFNALQGVALADGLGLMSTQDGGQTWLKVHTSLHPTSLMDVDGHARVVLPPDEGGKSLEVLPTGELVAPVAEQEVTRPVLESLYRDAVESGWPLEGGLVLMLRGGTLQRFNPKTGELEVVGPSVTAAPRCGPMPLRVRGKDTVGFVCPAAGPSTELLAYDGRSVEPVLRIQGARTVIPSSRGLFVMRGDCETGKAANRYCVYGNDEKLRTLDVQGDASNEQVIPLLGGGIALVTPPQGGLRSARVTWVGKGATKTLPLNFPPLRDDVLGVLERGVWVSGFEEREAGHVGGWVELAGHWVGIEIAPSGEVKVGTLLSDSRMTTVSGRFGFHWSSKQRAFQTMDGGLTWKALDVPDAVQGSARGHVCSAVGSVGDGWVRMGWGDAPSMQPKVSVSAPPALASVRLQCEPRSTVVSSAGAQRIDDEDGPPKAPRLQGFAPPPLRPDMTVASSDVYSVSERFSRAAPLGRLTAWVPKDGDWATQGMLRIQWLSPFEDSTHVRSSATMRLPAALKDVVAQRGATAHIVGDSRMVVSEDSEHALFSSRSWQRRDRRVFALSRGQVAQEILREDGGLFDEVDAAVFYEGRWFLGLTEDYETRVFVVDGGTARRVTSLPRVGAPPASMHLVQSLHEGGVILGLEVVQRTTNGLEEWVFPPGAAAGRVSLPMVGLRACKGDSDSLPFRTELALPFNIEVTDTRGVLRGTANTAIARVRLGEGLSPCVERIASTLDAGLGAWTAPSAPQSGAPNKGDEVMMVGGLDGSRRTFACRTVAH